MISVSTGLWLSIIECLELAENVNEVDYHMYSEEEITKIKRILKECYALENGVFKSYDYFGR